MAIIPKSIILFIIIGFVATLFSIALATPGRAGFFTKDHYVPTVCYGNTPQGNLIAKSDLGGEFTCGTSVNVTCSGNVPSPCTGKSVVVKVVNDCPGCAPTSENVTMDISEDAYRIIANPVSPGGQINIDYVKI